jgi:hypothetical protein
MTEVTEAEIDAAAAVVRNARRDNPYAALRVDFTAAQILASPHARQAADAQADARLRDLVRRTLVAAREARGA